MVSPAVDACLTAAMALTFGATVAALALGIMARGCPLQPVEASLALLLGTAVWVPIGLIVERMFSSLGASISRGMPNDPLKTKSRRLKFGSSCFQLLFHLAITALEAYILFGEGGGRGWMTDASLFWSPPPDVQSNAPPVHLLYASQVVFWTALAFSHRFLQPRDKDYVMMFTHHWVTLTLVSLSYFFNYVRIGTAVMFLHDSSDILCDLIKVANALKLEGWRYLFLLEISFVSNLVTFLAARLYYFPLHVIWRGAVMYTQESWTTPLKAWVPIALMSALALMHVIWYYMFLRITWRLATGVEKKGTEAAAEGYDNEDHDD